MKLVKVKDYEEMSRKAAELMAAQILIKPDSVLGLATGSSPIGLYENLVKWYNKGDLDFSSLTTINLDEYKGLDPENEQSYAYFMKDNLFSHVNIPSHRTHLPDGTAEDAAAECLRYTALIEELGYADLQLLGLGRDGHIGFNEPGDFFQRDVHVADLEESTIEANKRFFESADDVPRQAFSMGIGTILKAKKILVVVSGEDKAEALKNVLYGEITPKVPGSALQLHRDVTVIADEAARSLL